MDKIKALFAKSGCKPELLDQIVEALEQYKKTVNEEFKADYDAKIVAAQKICLEETEEHKRELSKRLEIFCEAKGLAIEAHIKKQSALNESESSQKLRNIQSLLSGVKSTDSDGKLAAELAGLNNKVHQISEERDKAVALANRQVAISERVLKQSRSLASKCVKLEAQLSESTGQRKPVNEGRRLDERLGRKAQPISTRPTLTESQDRKPPQRPVHQSTGAFGIGDIALQMDEQVI